MNTRNTRGFLSVPLLILVGVVLAGSAGVGAFVYFKHVPTSEPKEAALPEFEARVASSTTETAVTGDQIESRVVVPVVGQALTVTSDTAESARAAIRAQERAEMEKQTHLQKSTDIPGVWKPEQDAEDDKEIYDSAACMNQKKNLVPTVEAKYESWFAEWQQARTSLDSCYDTNSVPYCDGKMTELNVEWQAKWSVTVNAYYKKLDKCSVEDRRFGDISSTLNSY